MTGMGAQRLAAATLLAAFPLFAGATNGYFSHGFSAAQIAMGGAGTALPEDSMIATINPAGNVWIGDATDINLSLFSPIREYSASDRGPDAEQGIVFISPIEGQESHNKYWPLPAMSYNRAWGENASWGISMYGNGGMNTEYLGSTTVFAQGMTEPTTLLMNLEEECKGGLGGGELISGPGNFCGGGNSRVGVDLAILFVAPTLSYKLGDRSSVGISALGAMSRFSAQGLGAFAQFSNTPDKVTDRGHDLSFGGGFRIGVLTGLIPYLNIGASYQSKMAMSEFDEYKGLFADNGDFDIPETWNVGIALRLGQNLRVIADYQQINYEDVKSVSNPLDPNDFVNNCAMPRLFFAMGFGGSNAPSDACLGSRSGPGFGWSDMTVYKAGVQYTFGGFKFRAGYSTTDQPISKDQVLFNMIAPGVMEEHYTAGMSIRWSENMYIDIALMWAPPVEITGKNPLSNTEATLVDLAGEGLLGLQVPLLGSGTDLNTAFGPDPNDQDITLRMEQFQATFGVAWRF